MYCIAPIRKGDTSKNGLIWSYVKLPAIFEEMITLCKARSGQNFSVDGRLFNWNFQNFQVDAR